MGISYKSVYGAFKGTFALTHTLPLLLILNAPKSRLLAARAILIGGLRHLESPFLAISGAC